MPTLPVRNERRARPRHALNVPLEIDCSDRGTRIGVSQDASLDGMLFNTRSHFVPGEEVLLTLRLPGAQRARVKARVVRVSRVDTESTLPWRYLVQRRRVALNEHAALH
jgi:hypothetical protein